MSDENNSTPLQPRSIDRENLVQLVESIEQLMVAMRLRGDLGPMREIREIMENMESAGMHMIYAVERKTAAYDNWAGDCLRKARSIAWGQGGPTRPD